MYYFSTSRTGGQPSRRRRLGWRKGSMHGSTGRPWRQPECCSLHGGDAMVDSLDLGGPLACSLIRANLNRRAALSVCHRSVTGAVDTRHLAPRCALPWEYEAPDSRRSSRQLRRCSWLSLRARVPNCVVVHRLVGLVRIWLHPRLCEPFGIRDL